MVTLLKDGFGFHPESRDITFAFTVEGSEVEWTLGMALALRAEQQNEELYVYEEQLQDEHNATFDSDEEIYADTITPRWFLLNQLVQEVFSVGSRIMLDE
jgi:hypothetical protein